MSKTNLDSVSTVLSALIEEKHPTDHNRAPCRGWHSFPMVYLTPKAPSEDLGEPLLSGHFAPWQMVPKGLSGTGPKWNNRLELLGS